MSIYISRLVNRQGLDWPTVGTWKQGMGVNRLETFAKNLEISDAARTDLLNSVPTPWARLLLFEMALYDPEHPAHPDVVNQWRGLLGVVALSDFLRLHFDAPRRIDLQQLPGRSQLRDAFTQFRPRHVINGRDAEDGKWNHFSLISVDGSVLGATSPRTLVFTGIAHTCPESIPFRSDNGRLADPLKYYQKFEDNVFIELLAYWLDELITQTRNNQNLRTLLGDVPIAHGQPVSRFDQLTRTLLDWQAEFPERSPRGRYAHNDSPFEGTYSILRPLQFAQPNPLFNQSDLFLKEHDDVLVCFRRGQRSSLVNRHGMEIGDDKIKIFDGHWMEASQPLPRHLNFLPAIKVIEDPSSFFEDSLIEAPLSDTTSYPLQFAGKHYLLPYRKEILEYFTPEEIVAHTSLRSVQPNHVTVDLNIPLVNNRTVKVTKHYREDDEIVSLGSFPVANLAFWPTFIFDEGGGGIHEWNRYFYYKYDQGTSQLDFEPLDPINTTRSLQNRTWLETAAPLRGFVGTVDGRKGLLLVKYDVIRPPTKDWKVAIDLGSTHTRAFYLEVEKQNNQWLGVGDGNIRPIKIISQVEELTKCEPRDLLENFFVLSRAVDGSATEEFMSQLVMPQPNNEDYSDWLPREGLIYQRSLLVGFPSNVIKYNFKWNSSTTDYALRAYLRCLLLLIQVEALREGARVVSISHAFPSVFTPGLAQKHANEWAGLGNYASLQIEPPMMEAEAVGRYLQVGQKAAVTGNTIALDVGGSTTDIAIWGSNRLNRQESVKMAAGVAGRYVQTEPGLFKQELIKILAGEPFKLTTRLDNFKDKDAGFSLMFNAVLNAAASTKNLDRLVTSIRKSPEGQKLIAHIMFVLGALLYYAGLLSRKAKMPGQSQYYVYLCGKGGQLITWINNQEQFVQDMFSAGLTGAQTGKPDKVQSILSTMPKQEVGRGLLAESSLRAGQDTANQGGLVNLNPPTVTVGEEGYGGLKWDAELDGKTLAALAPQVPDYSSLKELGNFVNAFVNSVSTRDAAQVLGLSAREPADFRANLKERLFGTARGYVVYDLLHYPDEALLESLFITEAKVLLETITKNPSLFN
jgi:hypothetical protein